VAGRSVAKTNLWIIGSSEQFCGVKTEFSRDRDQHQVGQLLQAGCTHMMQAFDIENFNLDDLITTAMYYGDSAHYY
jgi:hypothetical protein